MQSFKTSVRAALLVILGLALTESVLADDKPGKIDITVIGVDGKPTEEYGMSFRDVGDSQDGHEKLKNDGKGDVVSVGVFDQPGNHGSTVIYVPDGKVTPVTIQMKPNVDFDRGEAKANQGKKDGDAQVQQDGYNEAKEATTRAEERANQAQQAIDDWARDNGIPIMKLSAVEKQIKAGESLGTKADSANLDRLKSYRDKLKDLERMRTWAEGYKKRLAALSPPEKKVSAVPSTCPEGQSGGVLAGLLNSVTGSSLTGICGETPEKDNKDRKPAEHDEHGED